jgi:prephenate dehydratase
MVEPKLFVFKGSTSQTGLATRNEFPDVALDDDEPTFSEINQALRTQSVVGILPMWNSHEGEITKSQAIEMLFQKTARLYRLWPCPIVWECLSRKETNNDRIDSIISVYVANTQCSKFIQATGAKFLDGLSTLDSYRKFKDDQTIDAALCAPGQNIDNFSVICNDAANQLNFTTFAFLGHIDSNAWDSNQWGSWSSRLFHDATGVYFGIEMPNNLISLSSYQQQLFSDLANDAKSIDDIPKMIFVTRRQEDSCGLLFEARDHTLSEEILTDDGYSEKIKIIPEIGIFNKKYTDRAYDYFKQHNETIFSYDFVRHEGTQTCFYACPSLGLITHGFESGVVEPVFRRIIGKYFELIDNGWDCSPMQRELFERYKVLYLDKGVNFINFHNIGI